MSCPELTTARLRLLPSTPDHDHLFASAFSDPELYRYLPQDPFGTAKWRERLLRWDSRRSPDGRESWLNWLACERESGQPVGHFQITIEESGAALLGYVVAPSFQRRGYAREALSALIDWMSGVREIRAQVDTRNLASIRLLESLGFSCVEEIHGADFFKGAASDEFVFRRLASTDRAARADG